MNVICNHDCFNCPYPDCMVDDITLDEYKDSNERDKEIKWLDRLLTDVQRGKAIYNKAYYRANKDRFCAYHKAYYETNKNKKLAYMKTYKKSNKDRIREYQKTYHEANKERIHTQKKAYYEANKERISIRNKAKKLSTNRISGGSK